MTSARGLRFASVRRGLGILIAFALVTASVAGCGSSGEAVQSSTEARDVKRVPLSEFEGREATTYRDGREYCGLETKAELAVEEGLPAGSSDVVVARQFASEWPPKLRRAAFQGCLAGLATAPARFPRSSPLAEDLWDRAFIATSVTGRGGGTPPITEPLEIQLSFSSEGRHSVGWGRAATASARTSISRQRRWLSMGAKPPRFNANRRSKEKIGGSRNSWRRIPGGASKASNCSSRPRARSSS